MTPDELRELAYRLETGIDLVEVCERAETAASTSTDFEAIANEMTSALDKACIRGATLVWAGSILLRHGNQLLNEQTTIKTAFAQPGQAAYPEDHVADVIDLNR